MTFTLTNAAVQFGVGTTVSLYKQAGPVISPPTGTPQETVAVQANGTLTFTTVQPESDYVATANGRVITFHTPATPRPTKGHTFSDEGTVLPDRSVIDVIGSAVTAADDAANDRTTLTVTTSGGAVYQSVDALSGNPRAVTDWGPLLNTAIAGGTKRFIFGPYEYPFSTMIDLRDLVSIVFEGAGGAGHRITSAHLAPSRLVWKGGAGSGKAIRCDGSDGIQFRDIGIYYDNVNYNGDLISADYGSISQTANGVIERCQIGSYDNSTTSARCLLRFTNAVSWTVEECDISGAQWLVRGFETIDANAQPASNQHPDNCRFTRNTMVGAQFGFFCNIGRYWTIEQNEFLHGALGGFAVPSATDSDLTCESNFTWQDNQHWDFANTSQKALAQKVANSWIAKIQRNLFGVKAGGAAVDIDLQGPGAITIEDNYFERQVTDANFPLVDCGPSATALKTHLRIVGNKWTTSSQALTSVVKNLSGHATVVFFGNTAGGDGVVSIPQERADFAGLLPSLTLRGGVTVSSTDLFGTDTAGYIGITTTGGSTAGPGLLVDITFGKAMLPDGNRSGRNAAQKMPCVVLTPVVVGTSDGPAAIACQPYASVATGQQTGFSLGVGVAIPVSKTVYFAYRVMEL